MTSDNDRMTASDTAVRPTMFGRVVEHVKHLGPGLLVAAAAFFGTGTSITDAGKMAAQLEPALGPAAKYFLALGLLAAGLSSAVTAPLASSYAICGCWAGARTSRLHGSGPSGSQPW
jgi:Mn2+/Fe2+ NRAMP family transporter